MKEIVVTDSFYEVVKSMAETAGVQNGLMVYRLVYKLLPPKLRRLVALRSAEELENLARKYSFDEETRLELLALAISYLMTAVGEELGMEVVTKDSEREAVEFLAMRSGRPEIYSCYLRIEEGDCAEFLLRELREYIKA